MVPQPGGHSWGCGRGFKLSHGQLLVKAQLSCAKASFRCFTSTLVRRVGYSDICICTTCAIAMSASQKTSPFGSVNREAHSAVNKRYSGRGLSGARHKQTKKPATLGVTKPDIRRLARKAGRLRASACRPAACWVRGLTANLPAGVKRIGLDTYEEAKTALTSFLKTILKDVGVITEGAQRMTVTVPDVLLALKRNGRCKVEHSKNGSFVGCQDAHGLLSPYEEMQDPLWLWRDQFP